MKTTAILQALLSLAVVTVATAGNLEQVTATVTVTYETASHEDTLAHILKCRDKSEIPAKLDKLSVEVQKTLEMRTARTKIRLKLISTDSEAGSSDTAANDTAVAVEGLTRGTLARAMVRHVAESYLLGSVPDGMLAILQEVVAKKIK